RVVLLPAVRAGEAGPVDPRVAVVAVEVAARQGGHRAVAHGVAADDRAVAVRVARHEDRRHVVRRVAGLEAREALEDAPAVVGARSAAAGEVDLLPGVLADVGARHVAGLPIEWGAGRVPAAVPPGFP